MIELLLRGQQTLGDLRTRASRFETDPRLGHSANHREFADGKAVSDRVDTIGPRPIGQS